MFRVYSTERVKVCLIWLRDENYGMGRGPAAVVKAACLESRRSRVRTPLWHSNFKETKMFLLRSLVDVIFCGSLRDWEVACSASDRHRGHAVPPDPSHYPRKVVLTCKYAQKWPLSNHSFLEPIIWLVLHYTRIITWLYERVITSHARHVNTRFVIWLHLEMWITAVISRSRSRWKKSSW